MYKWFERYFAFSRRELHGICLLGVLLLILWSVSLINGFGGAEDTHSAVYIDEIERFLASENASRSSADAEESAVLDPVAHSEVIDYFPFDPNGLAVVDWKRLGLSDRQIRMIKNYEAKGGQFRKKEDLARIYAISEADYARLAPHIRIAAKGPTNAVPVKTPGVQSNHQVAERQEKPLLNLELNTTDSLELQFLPGVGPVFASRIIRFRDLLGGFHHISQLMDVYGFDTLRFDGLKDQVYVDTMAVRKIVVNAASYEELRKHPLISPKLANAIVQYRKQHGPYHTLEDLLGIAIMDADNFRKIAPYLTTMDD